MIRHDAILETRAWHASLPRAQTNTHSRDRVIGLHFILSYRSLNKLVYLYILLSSYSIRLFFKDNNRSLFKLYHWKYFYTRNLLVSFTRTKQKILWYESCKYIKFYSKIHDIIHVLMNYRWDVCIFRVVYRQPSPSNTLPSFRYPLVPPIIPPPHHRRMEIDVNLLQKE